MLRPILPHLAWQAIAALAGSFTLACALAAPVDLWHLTVKSRQGEPFLALATLDSLPHEHISTDCLSMGPESDAPGSALPFLRKANLKLDAARNVVEISTDEAVSSPGLALVLRVQCAGAPLYARYFRALIPPAQASAQDDRAAVHEAKRHGFRLSLLPGDSVESVAAVIFPGKPGLQHALALQVIAGNPNAFPDGRLTEVPAGTILWFPDLREFRKSSHERSSAPVNPPAAHGARATRASASASASAETTQEAPAATHRPITLRRALELGDKPGPRECKQLMQLCGAESPAATAGSPGLVHRARALESSIKELHLKQESIEQQLQRLDQSLQALQKIVGTAPSRAIAAPAPPPPKVEIRTIVTSEPVDWYVWLGLAGLLVLAAIGGFAYGRRGSLSRGLAETDEQLDRMLASAATVMRELETTRPAVSASSSDTSRSPAAPPPHLDELAAQEQPVEHSSPETAGASTPVAGPVTEDEEVAREADHEPERGSSAPSQTAGLSNEILYEMDQALDNTRSMFTDVDRFIALGRTQNALSLLQFQVQKDPKDRDSWIKLMAIYRQENMEAELAKAASDFKRNFPRESPPGV